ncbi:sodium:solute symporter family protein [Robbsia sp. KACC 23696]|uniref:sodium:solute symporter family protein n=1 Tax=Robbsia sp. KACC 23696 TaxID=3149231 RepID=UPI00325B2584
MSSSHTGILHLNFLDYTILAIYFAMIVIIGLLANRATKTSSDFFLSARSMPAWITGIAFISANMGALEILGNAANGAQYGAAAVHFFWLGAIPAMVFLGVVMMPFYYSSRVHSVPEYLRRRFNAPTHLLNALIFAVGQILIAGINLYALALIIERLLGWPLMVSVALGAAFVLLYILLGGLSAAMYGEVLQFFVILAGLAPIVALGLHHVGGWHALAAAMPSPEHTMTWEGTQVGHWHNPMGDWIGLAMGEGFLLAFGYWTTNFAEVQRALSASSLNAARRTPIIGAFPKIILPLFTVVPGMIALVMIPGLGTSHGPSFNQAIPELMQRLLPNGVLGLAVTALLAGFMAGMAANISGFNTVFTYDLWKPYVAKDRSDHYYLQVGRLATIAGIVITMGTAFIAASYNNIQNYMQMLFSFFNTPLFTAFIIGLFWRKTSGAGAFWGMLAGTVGAALAHLAAPHVAYFHRDGILDTDHFSEQMANFYGAIAAFVCTAIVTVGVSLFTTSRPISELKGLIWGLPDPDSPDAAEAMQASVWYRSPAVLGSIVLVMAVGVSLLLIYWRATS